MSSKSKGIAFEREVKKELESMGYPLVARQAASLFPDLIALSGHKILLVECKLKGRISLKERSKLAELAVQTCTNAVIAYKKDGSLVLQYL